MLYETILFENYYRGHNGVTPSTVFSVTKSVTSLLAGIAVDEGYIESIDDPVTKYIPELKKKDPYFELLTLRHLLNMRAGFDFEEDKNTPFSKSAKLYYGRNLARKVYKLKFSSVPGEGDDYDYQSASTALLGLVIEEATGQELAAYLHEKVWTPLGMENRASLSLDDKRHRRAKAFGGFNTTARDLAKIGRLYLNGGEWEGKRIVSREWIKNTMTPDPSNFGYQYGWYSVTAGTGSYPPEKLPSDSLGAVRFAESAMEKNASYLNFRVLPSYKYTDKWNVNLFLPQIYALGILGQVLYLDPGRNIVVVILSNGVDDRNERTLIYNLLEAL